MTVIAAKEIPRDSLRTSSGSSRLDNRAESASNRPIKRRLAIAASGASASDRHLKAKAEFLT